MRRRKDRRGRARGGGETLPTWGENSLSTLFI